MVACTPLLAGIRAVSAVAPAGTAPTADAAHNTRQDAHGPARGRYGASLERFSNAVAAIAALLLVAEVVVIFHDGGWPLWSALIIGVVAALLMLMIYAAT